MKRAFFVVVVGWLLLLLQGTAFAYGFQFKHSGSGSCFGKTPQQLCAACSEGGWYPGGTYGSCKQGLTYYPISQTSDYSCTVNQWQTVSFNGSSWVPAGCVASGTCASPNVGIIYNNAYAPRDGTCYVSSCSGGGTLALNWSTSGNPTCTAPPCPQGTEVLATGTSTSPQCLGGCSYVAGGETRYTADGVLSRWTSSGGTCTAPDSLDAADTTGCPSEVPEDLRPLLCGLPSPCTTGQFLFMGECVADTTESGCVVIDGEQLCAEADQNCVVIDGKRVCAEAPAPEDLESYKENGCVWSFAQGAWVCPTQAATTTSTSTTNRTTDPVTGNTTEVTTNTTKNNTTGATTTTTTTTIYNSEGQQISQTKQETVDKPAEAAGVLAVRGPKALGAKPDLEWLRTAQEVKDNLFAQWESVPLVAAVSSFSNLQLSGVTPACPEFCLPFWGETLCTTKHCEIWATISFIISGVLLALYGMTAIRIVLSA